MEKMEVVKYQPLIRDLPAQERPRERLKKFGAASLSNAELLAIVLRTGAASESVINMSVRLLTKYRGLSGIAKAGFGELCQEHGLGEAKAAQIKATMELGRRLLSEQPTERVVVRSPVDIANLLQAEMCFLDQEELRLVLLNTKNQVMAMPQLYRGCVNGSFVRVSEIFREAIKENCPALVIVHNHPSGDPTPSSEDIKLTEQIVAAGSLLDIELLDHIVIGRPNYVSLKEKGLGFN